MVPVSRGGATGPHAQKACTGHYGAMPTAVRVPALLLGQPGPGLLQGLRLWRGSGAPHPLASPVPLGCAGPYPAPSLQSFLSLSTHPWNNNDRAVKIAVAAAPEGPLCARRCARLHAPQGRCHGPQASLRELSAERLPTGRLYLNPPFPK